MPDTPIGQDLDLRVETLPRLREQVAERLRMAIVTAHFKPGERLIERELCEKMAVSRTSLREALRELQADNLITWQPNKGMRVAVLTEETAQSIYETRAVLECLLARLFAKRATPEQMIALRESIEQLAVICEDYSVEAFFKAKEHYYYILMEGAGNAVAADMLRRIHIRASQLRSVALTNTERVVRSINELRALCNALEARDEDLAWKLCLEHVENATGAAMAAISESRAGEG